MGILKGIFKSRDKPKNATSGSDTDSLSVVVPLVRMSMSVLLCR